MSLRGLGGHGESGRRWPRMALVCLVTGGFGLAGYLLARDSDPIEPRVQGEGSGGAAARDGAAPPVPTRGVCGDGVVDPGEVCEPGSGAIPCAWLLPGARLGTAEGAESPSTLCRADCTPDVGVCTEGAGFCGDGVTGAGEQCDDGGNLSGDGCAADCALEVGGRRVHSDGELVDAQIRRSLQGSVCLDPAERRRVAGLPPRRVEYRLRVCRLPSGEPVFPLGRARAAMDAASRELWAAGIELVEDSAEVESFDADCRVPFGDPALRELAADSHGARTLPVFFVREVQSGAGSFGWLGYGAFGFGAVVATADPAVVLHELGHALGLSHTHACSGVPEGAGRCDETGDRLCDTPYDPGPGWWGQRCAGEEPQRCDAGCDEESCSGGAAPDRTNAMSYYSGCRGGLSGEQRDLSRCVLEHELAWLRPADECGSERCNRRDDDCDGEIDEDRVCDESCEPARDLALGTSSWSTRGASDAFEAAEGLPEAPDLLFRFAPSRLGTYCVVTGAGDSRSEPIVIEVRDGCSWSSSVLSTNARVGSDGVRVSPHFEVEVDSGGPVWLSASGLRGAAGIDFGLAISEGACGSYATPEVLSEPVLLSPSDRSRVRERPISFRWGPVSGAAAYEMRLGNERAGLTDARCGGCDSHLIEGTSAALPVALVGARLFWTVRAVRDDGREGPFAPARMLVVGRPEGEEALRAPRLLHPRGVTDLPRLVERFTWEPVDSAREYEVRIGLDRASLTRERCESCAIERTAGTDFTPNPSYLGPGQTYWWTVRALSAFEEGPFASPEELAFARNTCTAVGRLEVGGESEGALVAPLRWGGESLCGEQQVWLVVPERDGLLCADTRGGDVDAIVWPLRACADGGWCDDSGDGAGWVEVIGRRGGPLFFGVRPAGEAEDGVYPMRVYGGGCE